MSEVISGILSLRKAAEKYGLKPAILQHRVEKFRKEHEANERTPDGASTTTSSKSKYGIAQVFDLQQENALSEYLTTCSKMHYGLSLQQVLTLAYE